LPAQGEDRFILSELNSLSGRGMATQSVKVPGVAQIMRETTTWQVNSFGFSDDAYTDATTLATLTRLIREQRQAITSKFPRHKLADNDTRFGAGQKIVTPNIIKAELVAQYRVQEFQGLVENVRAFKDHLIVERNISDPTRLDVLWPPDLINALRIFAVLAQFRLQYDRANDLEIMR
jgi:phage tail sheath gpL-like